MRRWLSLLLLYAAPALSGCVYYPKVYAVTKKGTADLEGGKPVIIKASLIKSCETLKGETEKIIRWREARTDDKGRYQLSLRGVAWNMKSFLSGGGCESRVQMFICREVCKPVDEIDIDVLGK